MNQTDKIKTMVVAALLSAIGIIIPMFAPKVIIGPASFTLASHVPVFMAMFISAPVAAVVAIITSFGFLLAGFPLVIVLRAMTHLVFAVGGAYLLKKNGTYLRSIKTAVPFGLAVSAVHAAGEVIVVTLFYFGGAIPQNGYWFSVMLLVGVGTLVHSMVDYAIAVFIWKHVQNVIKIPVCAKV